MVPVAGPVPPPSMRGDAGRQRLLDLLRADEVDVASMPPAVRIVPSPAMTSVPGPMTMPGHAGCMSGLPALPMADDAAVLDADVGLDDAPVVEDQRVGDDGVERAVGAGAPATGPCRRGSPCRRRTRLLAVDGEVVLDLDDRSVSASRTRSPVVGPYRCAYCRRSIRRAMQPPPHARSRAAAPRPPPAARPSSSTGPLASAFPPRTIRRPAISTSATVRVSPGSKRTAVPAGTSRRRP